MKMIEICLKMEKGKAFPAHMTGLSLITEVKVMPPGLGPEKIWSVRNLINVDCGGLLPLFQASLLAVWESAAGC